MDPTNRKTSFPLLQITILLLLLNPKRDQVTPSLHPAGEKYDDTLHINLQQSAVVLQNVRNSGTIGILDGIWTPSSQLIGTHVIKN